MLISIAGGANEKDERMHFKTQFSLQISISASLLKESAYSKKAIVFRSRFSITHAAFPATSRQLTPASI